MLRCGSTRWSRPVPARTVRRSPPRPSGRPARVRRVVDGVPRTGHAAMQRRSGPPSHRRPPDLAFPDPAGIVRVEESAVSTELEEFRALHRRQVGRRAVRPHLRVAEPLHRQALGADRRRRPRGRRRGGRRRPRRVRRRVGRDDRLRAGGGHARPAPTRSRRTPSGWPCWRCGTPASCCARCAASCRALPQWFHYFAGLADKLEGRTIPPVNPNYFGYTRARAGRRRRRRSPRGTRRCCC